MTETLRSSHPPREFGGVREIVSSAQGWRPDQVKIVFDSTPPSESMKPMLQAAREHTQRKRVDEVLARGETRS